jgi:basic amino acid/polyamine antiporter, APA family
MTESQAGIRPWQLFSLAFGTMVGIAWVFLAGPWIRTAGPVGSVAALFGGAVAILPIIGCYARLAARFPGDGGEIRYVGETLGPLGGLAAGWLLAFCYITVVAFHCVMVAWLVDISITNLGGALGLSDVHSHAVGIGVSTALFAGVVLANVLGVTVTTGVQDAIVGALIVAILLLCIGAAEFGSLGNLRPYFASAGDSNAHGITQVLATTPFLYAGFNIAAQGVGDVQAGRAPRVRTVLGGAVIAAAVFYSVIILSIAAALPRAQLLAQPMPALDAFAASFHSRIAVGAVAAVALVALATSWNGVFFGAWKVLKAIAGKGLLPSFLGASVGKGTQAHGAIAVVTAVAAILSLGGRKGLSGIIDSSALMFGVVFSLVCAGDLLTYNGAGAGQGNRARNIRKVASGLLGLGAALSITAIALFVALDVAAFPVSLFVVLGWLMALVPLVALRWQALKRSPAALRRVGSKGEG